MHAGERAHAFKTFSNKWMGCPLGSKLNSEWSLERVSPNPNVGMSLSSSNAAHNSVT
jgi:hypothetical protein